MAEKTGIEWADATWNPWMGCRKISEGCKNCYMFRDMAFYGRDPKVVTRAADASFRNPLKWAKSGKLHNGARIFTCSWSDWFIKEADDWREEAWRIVKATPQFTYLILTKRPELIPDRLPKDWGNGYPNVWLGVSAENQERVNERIPLLMMIPANVRWVSAEPLLGSIDLTRIALNPPEKDEWGMTFVNPAIEIDVLAGTAYTKAGIEYGNAPRLNWIVTGGESDKKNPRSLSLDWVRFLRDQCKEYNIPFFHKQHGGTKKVNGTWGGRELDGQIWNQFPS